MTILRALDDPVPTAAPLRTAAPVLDVVVPVHNEERQLERSVRRIRTYLDLHVPWDATVTIADNASTDATWDVATRMAATLPGVRAVHLDRKGRGRALRQAWSTSRAAVVAYMDVDLSTSLDGLLPLVAPLVSGHSDLAVGSRLAEGARVRRGVQREMVSRAYNLFLHIALPHRFSDAQCGFKALRADVARQLLPLVEDGSWYFDTELLVLAERADYRIHEVPVDWTDDPDSRVDIPATALADVRATARLRRRLGRRPRLPSGARRAERGWPWRRRRSARALVTMGSGLMAAGVAAMAGTPPWASLVAGAGLALLATVAVLGEVVGRARAYHRRCDQPVQDQPDQDQPDRGAWRGSSRGGPVSPVLRPAADPGPYAEA